MGLLPTTMFSCAATKGARALAETNYVDAIAHFKSACSLAPDDGQVRKGLAVCLQHLGQYPQAEKAYRQALRLSPQDPELWANLGLVMSSTGRRRDACQCLEKAAEIAPSKADIQFNLGNAYFDAGQPNRAQQAYKLALGSDPNHYEAMINLGCLLKKEADLDGAEELYRNAIAIKPNRPEAYTNLAALLSEQNAHDTAEAVIQAGLELVSQPAELYYNLGNIYKASGQYAEALSAFQSSILIHPAHAKAHWNKALTHLSLGDFQRGWREYEWRCKKDDWSQYYPLQHPTPLWRGEDISDKVLLIHDEQGYGDTIQFSRYLAIAKRCCKTLIFETRSPLLALYNGMPHIDVLVERPAAINCTQRWDLHVPLLSLPFLLNTRIDSIPATTPYLLPDPEKVKRFAKTIDRGRLNIGLVWAGNPKHANDPHRSVPFTQITPLLQCALIDWHSLQLGPAASAPSTQSSPPSIRIWEDYIHSFADTAALIWNFDLVITVDTAVAHLGGALGKRTWLILPSRNVDWRWQLNAYRTPWYSSMALFRQSDGDGWVSVIAELSDRLKQFATPRH